MCSPHSGCVTEVSIQKLKVLPNLSDACHCSTYVISALLHACMPHAALTLGAMSVKCTKDSSRHGSQCKIKCCQLWISSCSSAVTTAAAAAEMAWVLQLQDIAWGLHWCVTLDSDWLEPVEYRHAVTSWCSSCSD